MKAQAAVLLSAALYAIAPGVHSQTAWPSKPIRWIVPFPPGGPADIVTRVIAHKLGERVEQPAIVENRGGAGGNVGHEAAAKSAPDGYTVLFVVPAIVTNPFYIKASVDPFRELAPVIHLDVASMVLLASTGFPPKTVAEVIAQIRAKPGAVSCAASGALPQVGCEMLRAHAGTDMIMVQYKGNAPALNALIGGEVNLLFDVVNTAQGQVKAGRVRAVASTNPRRGIGPFGELPVMAETIPEFELLTWHGVMVPGATPRDIVLRLNTEVRRLLAQADSQRRFADLGMTSEGSTPEALDATIKSEIVKWAKVIKDAGIQPQE